MDPAARDAFAHIDALEREVLTCWPGVWQRLDEMRGFDVDWPRDWCLLPMAATATLLQALRSAGRRPAPVAVVHALYLWRFTRSVWLFDEHLMGRLLIQVPDATPPVTELAGLPEWCVFIAAADPEWPGLGVFIHLEHDVRTGRPELRLLLDMGDGIGDMTVIPVYLDRPTLTEALADYRATAAAAMSGTQGGNVHGGDLDASVAALADKVDGYVAIAQYLARPEADITCDSRPGVRPARLRSPPRHKTVWRAGGGGGR